VQEVSTTTDHTATRSRTATWAIAGVAVVLVAGGMFVATRINELRGFSELEILEPDDFCVAFATDPVGDEVDIVASATPVNQRDHALLLTGLLHTDADADLNDDLATLRGEIDTALRTGDWSQPQATARRVDDDKIAPCDRREP
jgi:hypothetical protein